MLKFYYERRFKIFKLNGKLHDRIVLYRQNYINHIRVEHPEINMKKIISILEEPDYVYKESRKSEDYFYEKKFGENNYRVVITKYKPYVKAVVTGYKVENNNKFNKKCIYCIYNKKEGTYYEKLSLNQENDLDYFLELFKER